MIFPMTLVPFQSIWFEPFSRYLLKEMQELVFHSFILLPFHNYYYLQKMITETKLNYSVIA